MSFTTSGELDEFLDLRLIDQNPGVQWGVPTFEGINFADWVRAALNHPEYSRIKFSMGDGKLSPVVIPSVGVSEVVSESPPHFGSCTTSAD